MEKILSTTNSRIKKWASLHQKKYRDREGLFLVEGEHLIKEALAAEAVEVILTDTVSPFAFEPTIEVTEAVMKKLSANISDVHLIAVCRMFPADIKTGNRVILLDGVQDPGNLGTMIRTAVSFGFSGVILSPDCCDMYNEKTVRSTQGALFHLPIVRTDLHTAIAGLKEKGFRVIATRLEESQTMSEISGEKLAFVFGNEGQGVSKAVQEASDGYLRIEMDGFESLNVAVAAGIVMYHYRKGR
ncbi:MAG: RNA methyltransferase [Solobacterium sp.]|nr:RNA methyltransferase [Solobacterium sp.]